MKRVVITGMGVISPLGNSVSSLMHGIAEGKSAVTYMDGWDSYTGLRSFVGAPAVLENEKAIPRQSRRSMGRLSIFAVQAAEQAIADAQISTEDIMSGRCGCIIGSTMGGVEALNETFELMIPNKDLSLLSSMKFFQCVSHTAAMNVAQYLEITGYVMATAAACASSLQALGTGYELIRLGKQDMFLCGGAEELHPIVTGIFDILFATSTGFNDSPQLTPRPFDAKRDGIVCGEGSGMLVLEEYEHAMKRNAPIYAEVVGYHTCGSGSHVSQSSTDAMIRCMTATLNDADVAASAIDYVNAHATGTMQGDVAEVNAIKAVLGSDVPVSGLKGYFGHTLGASGAIELIASLEMMKQGIVYPTLHLDNISNDCQGVCHVQKKIEQDVSYVLKNCFAFGGINASLICKKI